MAREDDAVNVKVFAGDPAIVEERMNRWLDEPVDREIPMTLPLPPPNPGEIAVMVYYNERDPSRPRVVVPR